MKKITMTQIARELGVSRSLVSYALQDKYGVSESMRQKIIEKAIEMGYYKTSHATIKLTKNILIIIGEEYLGEDSFFSRIISGIEYFALSKRYVPKIVEMKDSENINEFMTKIIDFKPQGVIVIRQLDQQLARGFDQLNIPLVFVDLISPTSDCYEVRVNNFGNMYEMTGRLIEKGFRDFCFVGDIDWALSFRERYNGFVYACLEKNIAYRGVVGKSPHHQPLDEDAFAEYVSQNNNTVIVCASDSIAVSVYKIIAQAGKRIPRDFSVVGFDDVYFSSRMNPPLTTMHIPKYELGRVAFELLYEQFNYGMGQSRVICLNARYVERESVLDK